MSLSISTPGKRGHAYICSLESVPYRGGSSVSVFTPPAIGERSIVMSVSVCLSFSVFVRLRSYPRRLLFTKFLRLLPMAVARSSSGDVVVRYVLPVCWMTSCLHTMASTRLHARQRRILNVTYKQRSGGRSRPMTSTIALVMYCTCTN